MNRLIKAIIFDLGGVLIDWNPRHLYRKLFDDEAAMEAFLTQVCSPHWNEQQDAGRSFAEAVDLLVAQHPEQEPLIRAFWERWPETVAGAIEPTVAIVHELKEAGYTLAALSNWSAETFPRVRPCLAFLDQFDEIVISGELKIIKPDPKIFAHTLGRLGRQPEECLFIDDSLTNYHAAESLGIPAIHFKSAAQLREELRRLNLLS